jgi:hypothetical protein
LPPGHWAFNDAMLTVALLGAGGMGEVYLARDITINSFFSNHLKERNDERALPSRLTSC